MTRYAIQLCVSTKIDWAKQRECDRLSVCYHEAGHALVAEHFRLRWEVVISDSDQAATLGNKAFTGKTAYHPTTRFRKATLAFGGPLAEMLFQDREEWESYLDDRYWCDEGFEADHGLSDTDLTGIRCHPQRWRAYKLAGKILRERKRDLLHIAGILARKHWSCSYTWKHDSPELNYA